MQQVKMFGMALVALLFLGFGVIGSKNINTHNQLAMTMSDDVKAVVDRSCFGCHNTDSKNDDAKEDLDFNLLNTLSPVKQIGILKDMKEVLEKGEMPPKKFLARYPDKKLSDEEVQLLNDWVKTRMNDLSK